MLTHLVLFKYRDDVAEADRADHRARLRALVGVVPAIGTLAVGADVLHSARSYDTGLVLTVADRAALAAYDAHPAHGAVAALGRGLCAHVATVDFESGPA